MIPLNYIWIGKPSIIYNFTSDSTNHDVTGVLKMLKVIENSPGSKGKYIIYFWCLDEYVSFYITVFQKYFKVKIIGIRKYLKNKIMDKRARKILELFEIILLKSISDSSERIKYYVNIKDLLSLAVTYFKGGYTLDTNVFPTEKCIANFPVFDKLRIVMLDNESDGIAFEESKLNKKTYFNFLNKLKTYKKILYHQQMYNFMDTKRIVESYNTICLNNVECWLIYSPKNHSSIKNALDFYLSHFNVHTIKNYYTYLIITSLINGLYSVYNNNEIESEQNYFIAGINVNHKNSYISSLQVQKKYYNTHK